MQVEEKKKRLIKQVKTIIEGVHNKEILQVLDTLDITEKEIIEAYVSYDFDVIAYGNEIYESLPIRAVLYVKNYLKSSWHIDRQRVILKYVQKIEPKSIIDMGFGVPGRYVKEYVLKNEVKLTLLDSFDSAFKFGEALLRILDNNWKEKISFKKLDMSTHAYPGDFQLYIFQDSIEHVEDATDYLTRIVKKSPVNSNFILSLPIGPRVPVHTIAWKTKKEADVWLKKRGLKVKDKEDVYTNPKGDFWAEQLNPKPSNFIVLCGKR